MRATRITTYSLFFFSTIIALGSYRFIFLGLPASFSGMSQHIDHNFIAFSSHIILAPLALLLGAIQFLPKFQISRMPVSHRWVGRAYGIAVLFAGISGFWVALDAKGGVVATSGFALLAGIWVFVTAMGINYARQRLFTEHRRWMLRSFALTLAGVTLRLQLLLFSVAGLSYTEASVYLAWSCWVPNLFFINWWLLRHGSREVIS